MVRTPRELEASLERLPLRGAGRVRRRLALPREAGSTRTATSRSRSRSTATAAGSTSASATAPSSAATRRSSRRARRRPSRPRRAADLCARAVRAVVEAGYENVGTLEFLVDGDGNFYFIEINCRIQVEHPVTEMLTGIDLVAIQIRIAAGEPLGLQPGRRRVPRPRDRVPDQCRGPRAASSGPSAGVVERYLPPGGPGVRMDSHLYSGYEVPPYYDSLLGKLIVWGPDPRGGDRPRPRRPRRAADRGRRHEHRDPPALCSRRGVPRGRR